MLLAINANNTNVKFAVFDGDLKRAEWRISTDSGRTADEYAVWLSQLMSLENFDLKDITDAIIAIVVPQALFELKLLCRKYCRCSPQIID